MNLCECGCRNYVSKEGNRFIQGHHVRGKKHSIEHKKKMSLAMSGKNNPFYGKHHSGETKKKMSGTNNPMYGRIDNKNPFYGKHHTIETRQKISKVHKDKHLSEEHKKKIRENHANTSGSNNPMYGRSPILDHSYGQYSICNKGHQVRSSWERIVADWLFEHNIEYLYESERFYFGRYSYLPDFYIPSLDLWIEVKGYMYPKNIIQHKLFIQLGYKLLVLDDPKLFEQTLREVMNCYEES